MKKICPQIEAAIKILNKSKWNHRDSKNIKELEKIGFKIELASGIAFLGREQVIKASLFVDLHPPEKSLPTMFLKKYSYCGFAGKNLEWVVQPLAEVLTEKEFNRLDNRNFFDMRYGYIDIKAENICRHRGTIQVLDW